MTPKSVAIENHYLEASSRIGARLCRDAIWAGDRCNWLGDSIEFASNTWTVAHRSFGPDLYAGTSGIALFLGSLYELTGERVFLRTAEGALRQAWTRRESLTGSIRFSFYSGWLGMAWVRDTLGAALRREDWVSEGKALTDSLAKCEISPQLVDIITGSAGSIPALLELDHRLPRPLCRDLARLHAENLLRTARRSDAGLSWQTLDTPCKGDLTGFSHGTAGIACALLEAAETFGDERFRQAGMEALRYERQWFDPRQENWADLRVFDTTPAASAQASSCSLAWCHGAPGIALSRLRAYELLRDNAYRAEAETALRTTAKALSGVAQPGFGNFSLCHGHTGNAESLLYAAQVLNPAYRTGADEVGHQLARLIMQKGVPLPCGVPNGGETPGLMLGLAGMGYFLLRLHAPARIPSVMILRPSKDPSAGKQLSRSGLGEKSRVPPERFAPEPNPRSHTLARA